MKYNGLIITDMNANINKSDRALLLSIKLHTHKCKDGKVVMKFDRRNNVTIISSTFIDNNIEKILLFNPQNLLSIYNNKFKLKKGDK